MEQTESTEASEPTDPIDKIEPAEPIDKIEPLEPILGIDPEEPAERDELSTIPMRCILAAPVSGPNHAIAEVLHGKARAGLVLEP